MRSAPLRPAHTSKPVERARGRRLLMPILALAALALSVPGDRLGAQDRSQSTDSVAAPQRLSHLTRIPTPPLDWDPPTPEVHELEGGVEVFHLHDPTLPMVSVYARFNAGPSNFPREQMAAASAVSHLVGSSGTRTIPADSLDRALAFYAARTSFGGGGQSSFASVNTLTRHLEPVLDLWFRMLREPRFDSTRVEEWRGRRLEGVRRREDSPGSLAVAEFNRLMYGDHPIGWQMQASDLTPERLSNDILRRLHSRIYCRGNLTLGIAGDVEWDRARRLLEIHAARWPECPVQPTDPPLARFERDPGVYLIRKDLPQSTIVIAQPSTVHLAPSAEYYASRIGNVVLGAGGFTSRLVSEVRTERGLAYSVSSVWTTPRRSPGLIGALGQTGAETTVQALRAVREVFAELDSAPPTGREVADAIDRIRNGYVFNFQDTGQIVSRLMAFREQDLPLDWLSRYLAGIQEVTAAEIHRVVRSNVTAGDWVILVVGDPGRFGEPLETLGPVTEVEPGGSR